MKTTLFQIVMAATLLTAACGEETGTNGDSENGGSSTDDPSSGDADTDGDTDTDADGDTDADTDADGDPSSGCGASPPESGVFSVPSGGEDRTYILDLPTGYSSDTPYPLVFGFHGMGGSGELFKSRFYGNLLSAMGDEAIVVHPDATGEQLGWDTDRDIDFFDAMLAKITAEVCVDESRIFATGHSSGGFFSNSLGCARGDVLRGIAPVSGGGPFIWGTTCTGQVAAWIAHAENDEVVAFSSGEGSRDHWAEANSCDLDASTPSGPTECVAFGGCDGAYPVHWCVYQDGHNWPEFAPEGMWTFFKSL